MNQVGFCQDNQRRDIIAFTENARNGSINIEDLKHKKETGSTKVRPINKQETLSGCSDVLNPKKYTMQCNTMQ